MKVQNSLLPTTGNSPGEERKEQAKHSRSLVRGRALISIGVVLLAVFGVVTAAVLLLDPLTVDVPVTRAVQSLDFPAFGWLMQAVSWLGFSPQNFIWPVIVVLGVALLKRFAEAVFLAIATALNAVTELVKLLVHRGRPSTDLVHVIGQSNTYSFPSGHVSQYVLFFGFSFYLVFTLMKRGTLRTLLLVLCGALVLLVGPSRIWMGQHWFSDVLGGYALATGLLLLVIWGYRGWQERRIEHGASANATGTS